MEVGRTFFVTLVCGLITLALLMAGVFLPAQLTFESRPYARAIMLSGKLQARTADELGITQNQLEMVKLNYREFLKRNKVDEGSDSSDSSDYDEDSPQLTGNTHTHATVRFEKCAEKKVIGN